MIRLFIGLGKTFSFVSPFVLELLDLFYPIVQPQDILI